MLVQSGGGKVYAVIANNEAHELALLPTLQLNSQTIFLLIRCRFKALKQDAFDPMLTPKTILVGGIERSANTLRGNVMMNTGFTMDKIGPSFPTLIAEKLQAAAPGFILPMSAEQEAAAVYAHEMRADFVKDFAQLVESALAPIYPPKDFSDCPVIATPYDMAMATENAKEKVKTGFEAVDGGKADQGAQVTKFPFGDPVDEAEDEAAQPIHDLAGYEENHPESDAVVNIPEKQGVDNPPEGAPTMGSKIKVLGSVSGSKTPDTKTTEEAPTP